MSHGHDSSRSNHLHGEHHASQYPYTAQPLRYQHVYHQDRIDDLKKRFWISLVLAISILFLSHNVQAFVGLENILNFPGVNYIAFILSTIIFFYSGWPFFSGLVTALKNLKPGMMTLIAIAVTVAYVYSNGCFCALRNDFFLGACKLN